MTASLPFTPMPSTPAIDPQAVMKRYYDADSPLYALLVRHGEQVGRKALAISDHLAHFKPNRQFIAEAAMLHDIGIFLTHSPALGCRGRHPYLCHGVLGRELLEQEGLPLHAAVCERHVGVGFSAADIEQHNLPLPRRNMVPVSLEEVIICIADKYFSKSGPDAHTEKTPAKVLDSLAVLGPSHIERFLGWLHHLGLK